MEYAKQRSEFANALLDMKAKHVGQNAALKIVAEMDSVMMGFVYAMMDTVEETVL